MVRPLLFFFNVGFCESFCSASKTGVFGLPFIDSCHHVTAKSKSGRMILGFAIKKPAQVQMPGLGGERGAGDYGPSSSRALLIWTLDLSLGTWARMALALQVGRVGVWKGKWLDGEVTSLWINISWKWETKFQMGFLYLPVVCTRPRYVLFLCLPWSPRLDKGHTSWRSCENAQSRTTGDDAWLIHGATCIDTAEDPGLEAFITWVPMHTAVGGLSSGP